METDPERVDVLADRLGENNVTGPRTGTIPKPFLDRVRRAPDGEPVVLVLTDRFSESIDLDGGRPSLVHHDLSWNPVRLTQRWGRLVRVRTGFVPIPPERIYVPVLDTEVDQRLALTIAGRRNLAGLMVPAAEEGDGWQLPDKLLRKSPATFRRAPVREPELFIHIRTVTRASRKAHRIAAIGEVRTRA